MVTTSSVIRDRPSDGASELAQSIHDTIVSVLHQMQPTVEAEGISKPQLLAMHMLSGLGAASVSAIARHLAVKAPTVCVTVDQLEAAGLVTRERSSSDHRTVEVSLTPKGRKVEARVWARIGQRIADAARDLPPEDVATANRIFRELNRRLEPMTVSQGARA